MITSALERSVPATVSTVSSTEDTTDPPPSKKAKSLFSFMPEPSAQSESQSTSLSNELDNYLQSSSVAMEVNPIDFGKKKTKYPQLSKLAKEMLGVPSSSPPVKHLFSIAGKLFRPERCNLKDLRFEELMFIRCNNN